MAKSSKGQGNGQPPNPEGQPHGAAPTNPPKPKERKTLKLNAAAMTKMGKALDDLEAHIQESAAIWAQASPEQRRFLLAHSPIMSRFLSLARRFD